MLKKRAVIYFVVIAFPMGLGAGASTWLKLPRINLPVLLTSVNSQDGSVPKVEPVTTMGEQSNRNEAETRLPDFGAVHPLVVGTFSLLLCSGILLAADQSKVG